jgi:Tfp pilus assembly protein PilV
VRIEGRAPGWRERPRIGLCQTTATVMAVHPGTDLMTGLDAGLFLAARLSDDFEQLELGVYQFNADRTPVFQRVLRIEDPDVSTSLKPCSPGVSPRCPARPPEHMQQAAISWRRSGSNSCELAIALPTLSEHNVKSAVPSNAAKGSSLRHGACHPARIPLAPLSGSFAGRGAGGDHGLDRIR